MITNQMIRNKASIWISQSKTRNKRRSKFHKYFVPDKDDLIAEINKQISFGMVCEKCKEPMAWNRKSTTDKRWRIISLHHVLDGYELICDACNNARGRSDLKKVGTRTLYVSLYEDQYDKFLKIKEIYPYGRRGALVEDMIEYVKSNLDDFFKFIECDYDIKLKS